jgi:hypothetical protein
MGPAVSKRPSFKQAIGESAGFATVAVEESVCRSRRADPPGFFSLRSLLGD